MAAFGYGSAYSFNNAGQNDMLGGGSLSQNPRSIVPMSQTKGAMQTGAASTPTLSSGTNVGDVYGVNFGSAAKTNLDLSPLFGGSADSSISFLGLRNADQSGMNPAARLAGQSIGSDAYWRSGTPTFDPYSMAAGDMGQTYSQAYDYLNSALSRDVGARDENGLYFRDALQTGITNLQSNYQKWLNSMFQSGAYGMSGSTSYGGGY